MLHLPIFFVFTHTHTHTHTAQVLAAQLKDADEGQSEQLRNAQALQAERRSLQDQLAAAVDQHAVRRPLACDPCYS